MNEDNDVCLRCATLEGSDLVLSYFEDRFLRAHPEIATLAKVTGAFDSEVVWDAASQMADDGDETALDLMVAFNLWIVIEEELVEGPEEDPHKLN